MKVVILAGGFGTRLSEYTSDIPKPMVTIGGKPILLHIMNLYASYGHKDFHLAVGYKAEVVKDFFLNYKNLNSDFRIDLKTGKIESFEEDKLDWKVTIVDTGLESMTGGRVKRLKEFIGTEPFLLTYGDGLVDLDINEVIKFHKEHGKMVTVTAVHPTARFGELDIVDDQVTTFKEKPQTTHGWVNGGYFVIQPEFLELIEGDDTILEATPLEKAAELGELKAFFHKGYWKCMDTKRDRDDLEEVWKTGKAPWKN